MANLESITNPNNPTDEFDPLQFPPIDIDFLSSDLIFPEGGFDLGEDFDFSFLDDNENFNGDGSDALSSKTLVESQGSGDRSEDDRGLNCTDDAGGGGSSSSSQDSGGCRSGINGFLNSPSPESGVDSAKNSSNERSEEEVVMVGEVNNKKVKLEEGNGGVLKRKMGKEEEETSILNRESKLRKSVGVSSPSSGQDDEDKRKARLMRNRESAQLSRQRKKHYVEELEGKVKSMHSMIADLNNKISYFMAENATLRQQWTGGAVCAPPPPGMYPAPMAHMPYPWMPYPMKPQGSVPLVPIPRLRPQQSVHPPKAKKSESKKKESKVKKAASVSFLGLLFFMLLFGGLVPFVDVRYGGRTEMVDRNGFGFGFGKDGLDGPARDRVLTVNGSHKHVRLGLHGGKSGIRQCGSNGMHCKRGSSEGMNSKDKRGSEASPGSDGFGQMRNSSEPFVASLYVPRNDKLVKIDGNLIINSVLASEKAKVSSREASSVKSSEDGESSISKVHQTSLAIARNYAPPYAVSNNGRSTVRHPHMYRISSERQKALSRGSRDGYKENLKSADGSLQKWFHEGLTGPIFSSGMCTEVFQFDTSPAPGAIIPATSTASDSAKNPQDSVHLSKRNRRILGHLPMTLNGSEFNSTKFNSTNKHAGRSSEDGKLHANESTSSMIVSVLVDPREHGDGEGDGVFPQKSMSRIFVVVLIDSVKYVTYSCILPLKGSGPHLKPKTERHNNKSSLMLEASTIGEEDQNPSRKNVQTIETKDPMDDFVKNLSSPTRSDLMQRTHSWGESNENELGSESQNLKRTEVKKHFMLPTVSAASKASFPRKKVLEELESNSFDKHLPRTPKTDHFSPSLDLGSNGFSGCSSQITKFSSKISDSDHNLGDLGSNSYDPLRNYLSPRPKFLRYNPNRRAEILHRRESELRKRGDGLGGITKEKVTEEEKFLSSSSPSSVSQERPINQEDETSPTSDELVLKLSQNEDEEGEEIDNNDDEEDEEVEEEEGSSWWKKVLKFLIILGVLFSSTLYISSMNSPTKPASLQPLWDLQERFGKIQNHVIGVGPNGFRMSSVFLHQFDEKDENFMEADVGGENGEIVGVVKESGLVLDQMEMIGREKAEIRKVDIGVEKLILSGTEVKSDDSVSGEDPVKDEAEVVMSSEVNELPSEEVSIEEIGRGEMMNSGVEKLFDVKSDEAELIIGENPVIVEAIEVISSELNELPSEEVSSKAIENEEMVHEVDEARGEGFSLYGKESDSMEISDPITASDSERVPEVEVIADQGIMIVTLVVSLLSLVALSRFLKFLHRWWRKPWSKQMSHVTELPVEPTVVEERVLDNGSALPTQENVIKHKAAEEVKSIANPSASSVHSKGKGLIQLSQSQAPRVELLGEYVVDRRMSTSVKSCSVKPRLVESEESNFLQSQEKKKPRRKPMSVPTQEQKSLSGFSATDSHSYGLVTVQEKILRREEGRDGEEVMKVVTTPVRRSSRIRNGVTSPL